MTRRGVLARLSSASEDARYDACKLLRDAARIDSAELHGLLAALDDTGSGLESVPDHAGGYQLDPVAIAEVARAAIAKHGRRWRVAIRAALPKHATHRAFLDEQLARWDAS